MLQAIWYRKPVCGYVSSSAGLLAWHKDNGSVKRMERGHKPRPAWKIAKQSQSQLWTPESAAAGVQSWL
jgi:hypothetical protein